MNILITGCSSGIGFQLALSMAEQGYTVFATVLEDEEKKKFTHPNIYPILLNLLNKESILKCVDEVNYLSHGKIDVLMNNAGVAVAGAIEDVAYETLAYQFQINDIGLCELTRLILPLMHEAKTGTIINISSMLSICVFPYRGIYAASKYALRAINDALRLELKAINSPIRVVLIESGPLQTEIRENAIMLSKKYLDIDASRYKQDYAKLLISGSNQKEMFFIKPPIAIVGLIVKIIKSRRPRALYRFGILPKVLNILKMLLPISLFDQLILYILTIE
ncbi:MAG: hypothetical protein LEGION0403_FIIPPAGN_00913 [Legionella sp.]|uniref:SDR family NAD(P)-dependent oxidoreductase n=1 Tax=Legionella sp. TaxID=459 RepID=UPI003D0E1F9E